MSYFSLARIDENLAFIWYDLMNDRARALAIRSISLVLLGSLLLIAVPYGISFYIDGLTNQLLDAMLVGGMIFLSLQVFEIWVSYARQQLRERFFQEEFWFLPQAITQLSFMRPLSRLTGESSDINGSGIESLRDKVWNVIGTYIYTIIPIMGLTIFGLAACFFAHPLIGAIALTYAVVELSIGRMNNKYIQAEMRDVIDQMRRWGRRMNDWWSKLDHIKHQGNETKILRMMKHEVQPALIGDDKVWRIYYAKWIAIRQTLSLMFASLVYVTTGYLVYNGVVSGAAGVLVFFSLQRVRNTLRELSDQQRDVQSNLATIAKYKRTLTAPVPYTYDVGVDFTDSEIALTFDGVSHDVQSNGEAKQILRDVSLHIPAGQKVGVVGPSGAGKSQLLSLLVRATDPISGSIRINQTDLRNIKPESLLRYYGVIMQKSEPYEDTILGNLLFPVSHLDLRAPYEDLDPSEQSAICGQARLALQKAGLDPDTFEHGIFTNIGYKGLTLSGGQQQRLQIAAAHFKQSVSDSEACLFIADEPTASLDSLSELKVMQHLQNELPASTTMLMVAHRLSTVANMDKIVFVRPLASCTDGRPQVIMYDSLADTYKNEALFREMADAQHFIPTGIKKAA